jgi:integrase/recombinase XerD
MKSVPANIQLLLSRLDAHMKANGYAASTRGIYACDAKHFLTYLEKWHIPFESVTVNDVERHLSCELRRYCRRHGNTPISPQRWCVMQTCGIHLLLRVVLGQWPLPKVPSTPHGAVRQQIGREYAQWLITFRGLATETVSHRFDEAGRFLEWLGERINSAQIAELTSNTIDAYLTFRAPPLARRSLKLMASDLRCFLRFLYSTGRTAHDLAPFVIAPKLYAFESLPSALRAEDVRAVIERARHDQSAKGLRDYAILLLLGTYGLRDGEVVHLRLEDVDWHGNKLYIRRSKTRTESCLPLISSVGEAILAYLRDGRPKTSAREIFICTYPPYRPLSTAYQVIQARLNEAKIRPAGKRGAHSFRHAKAVGLLRAGISTKQIGDVLGHRSITSTMIYLKLATEDLRAVALEIPVEVNAS